MCRAPDSGLVRGKAGLVGALKGAWNVFAEFNKTTHNLPSSRRQKGRSRSDGALIEKEADARKREFTMEEVSLHNTEEDCWLVIKNLVYDVTGFAADHPGGRVIYTYGGKDATDVFATFHATATWSQLRKLCVGKLVAAEPVPELLKDFRELRAQLLQKGLFKSSKLYYIYKVLSTFALLAVAVTVLLSWRESYVALVLSAGVLGLFWQQSGWLAHDFLHHQVFVNRWANNAMGMVMGNVVQGFSVDWWKSKHNTHHAAPNELTPEGKHAVDPDIDTLPLLAWSSDMLEAVTDSTHRFLVRMQQYFFFPILLFARVSWCQASVAHATSMTKAHGWEELAYLGLHYAWYLGLAFGALPPLKALLFVLLSQTICGFLLGIVFVQSHNGMEVYSEQKDFVTAQVVSTRDILSTLWNDWFTGGLNYQIEHHLFPSLPRHNLGKVQAAVQALCEKHGLVYENCGMATGTMRVLKRLAEVAAQA